MGRVRRMTRETRDGMQSEGVSLRTGTADGVLLLGAQYSENEFITYA
jgi:hypothetical protein